MVRQSTTSRLVDALSNGERLTTKQISHRYNLANPRDAVYKARNNGFVIKLDEEVNSKGKLMRKYSLIAEPRNNEEQNLFIAAYKYFGPTYGNTFA